MRPYARMKGGIAPTAPMIIFVLIVVAMTGVMFQFFFKFLETADKSSEQLLSSMGILEVNADKNTFSTAIATDKKQLQIKESYTEGSSLPKKPDEKVSAVLASGSVEITDELGYGRIILVDSEGNEHLVFSSDELALGAGNHSFTDICSETCELDDVAVAKIKTELANATISIERIDYAQEKKRANAEFDSIKEQKKEQQLNEKIRLFNKRIEKNNEKWVAGETSVAKLSYAEKKAMFGGTLPNLYGFEYYKGGIFSFPETGAETYAVRVSGAEAAPSESPSSLPSSFSWTNKHGENWMTPVHDQVVRNNGCWAFAEIATVEGVTNLYYNQHINPDISELDLMCNWNSYYGVWDRMRGIGTVEESCKPFSPAFPYDCTYECLNPENRRWRITNWALLSDKSEEGLKRAIVDYGPVELWVFGGSPSSHVIPLTGYGYDAENRFFVAFKNSFGSDWGEVDPLFPEIVPTGGGYGMMYLSKSQIESGEPIYIIPPPIPQPGKTYNVACVDKDKDGYCNWGIGPRPASCPATCSAEPDVDDSDNAMHGIENCLNGIDDNLDSLTDCGDTLSCPYMIHCDSAFTKRCNADRQCENFVKWTKTTDISVTIRDTITDTDGNAYFAGQVLSTDQYELIILKYNADGNVLWTKTSSTPYGAGAKAITFNSNGDIYVTGFKTNANYQDQLWLVKINKETGSFVWTKETSHTYGAEGIAIANDSSGNIYIVGIKYTSSGTPQVYISKYDSAGNLKWEKTDHYMDWYLKADIALSNEGYLYVTTGKYSAGYGYFLLLKYDQAGNKISEKIGTTANERGERVVAGSDGNVYVMGTANGKAALWKYAPADGTLTKYDLQIGYSSIDLAESPDGNLYMLTSHDTLPYHVIRKTTKNGLILWDYTLNDAVSVMLPTASITVDRNKNSYVGSALLVKFSEYSNIISATCGNGIIEPGEVCDGYVPNGECSAYDNRYSKGYLTCEGCTNINTQNCLASYSISGQLKAGSTGIMDSIQLKRADGSYVGYEGSVYSTSVSSGSFTINIKLTDGTYFIEPMTYVRQDASQIQFSVSRGTATPTSIVINNMMRKIFVAGIVMPSDATVQLYDSTGTVLKATATKYDYGMFEVECNSCADGLYIIKAKKIGYYDRVIGPVNINREEHQLFTM